MGLKKKLEVLVIDVEGKEEWAQVEDIDFVTGVVNIIDREKHFFTLDIDGDNVKDIRVVLKLKEGFYISDRNEKVYLVSIERQGSILVTGKQSGEAKRFESFEDAHEFLDLFDLQEDFKVKYVP